VDRPGLLQDASPMGVSKKPRKPPGKSPLQCKPRARKEKYPPLWPSPPALGPGSARGLAHVPHAKIAVHELGNGRYTSADDTVPYALWAAARNLDDYEQAIWTTASTGGDVDTTCGIVGGIVAARTGAAGLPAHWLAAREPLPAWAGTTPQPGT